MKKVLIFAAALSLLIPLTSCKKQAEVSLDVMSYNIRLGVADDGDNSWDIRKRATPAMLQANAPDIFGVQEAYDFQVAYIAEQCPQYVPLGVGREDGVAKGEHMSIFYNKEKIDVVEWGTYWLSETPDVPSKGWDAACYRTATWALLKLKDSGKQFYYVNTHLDHKGVEARAKGLALIADKIAAMNPKGYPMVLTGDFNVYPDNPGLEGINAQMKDARVTAENSDDRGSFNGWGQSEGKVIDYIYYAGFAKCTDFKVVTDTYENIPYISDHYPVKAHLVF